MAGFKRGDRLVLSKNYTPNRKAGDVAVATDDWNGALGSFISVQWEKDNERESLFGWRFEAEKTETTADSVDALIDQYAISLRKAIDNGTMVEPYSEIGIFASFLMDYKRLESK